MDDKSGERIFECYYTDAPLADRLSVWGISIAMILVFTLIIKVNNIYLLVIACLIYVFIPLWFEFGVYMIRTRSIIELTDNNEIVVRRWMCRRKSYPIDKIESIRVVDFDEDSIDRLTRDCIFPMPVGNVNQYPTKGVIVFFDRKWIKSVRPVFFNAANPEQFAIALANESGKPVYMSQEDGGESGNNY